jgi:hypothetical protein
MFLLVWPSAHGDTISHAYAGNLSTLTSSVCERDNIVRLGVNYMLAY